MPPKITDDVQNLFLNKKFNDPFLLNSNLYIPNDFYTALEFALYLAIKNPLYTQAAKRTVSYFLTDVEFIGKTGDQRERDDMREYLIEELDLFGALQQCGMEQLIFGNSFLRIHYPFDRFLVDRRDGYRLYALNAFGDNITYNYKNLTYNVPDPKTLHLPADQQTRIDLEFIDRKVQDMSRIALRILNPMRMMLNMNFVSGRVEYIYRFEEFFRAAVQRGEPIHQINDTPIEMLKAIRDGEDFKFNPGTLIHFKEPFISGLSYNGWGIPNILLNYNTIHQVQVLRCINEAVGLDYMLPFRLISPNASPGGAGADIAAATNIGRWTAAMGQLIAAKRKDPTALHTVPFPVTYQELGANGKALAPVDLMKAMNDEVLNGFGYPAELWHMTVQFQAVPTAIRMFEMTFLHLMRAFNQATKFVAKNIQDYMERDPLGVKLSRPRVADDLERKHIYLQLASGAELSRATAWKAFNIDDPIEEKRRRLQEDIEIQKIEQKENQAFEREMTMGSANQVVEAMMQAQQEAAGPPPGAGGGAPPPGGGGGGGAGPNMFMDGQNVTPIELEGMAQEQAQQLLQMPNGERRKAMNQLRASNPVLYAVVQRKMEDMRQQGASQGRAQVSQGG